MRTSSRAQWPITSDLTGLRRRLARYADQVGLTGRRRDDLLLAAHEATINVLEHGGASGTVSVWQDEETLTVDVADDAGRLAPGDARRDRPSPRATRGFGLWLMGQICDEFTIRQADGRSHVRLRMKLTSGAR
ncbi:ATP-binding protein [Streptosporangium sp. NPDC050855]|uniref:ATP-binding protein n=1 Tax=Streptosporangium sp. NPDC050855 TaxID=3366194 RepID=UPI0037BA2763